MLAGLFAVTVTKMGMSKMTRSISRALTVSAIGFALVLFQTGDAAAVAPCVNNADCKCNQYGDEIVSPNPLTGHDPQNIVLVVLDDASLSDLPFLNAPVVWYGSSTDPNQPNKFPNNLGEAGLLQPEMNRLGARSFAVSEGSDMGYLGRMGQNRAGALVVPRDLPTAEYPSDSAPTPNPDAKTRFKYDENATDAAHNVIHGFGGFGTLATTGVVIGRHYAPSSLCSPTRASILTGRYPSEVGVPDNNLNLDNAQLTIADFLKKVGPRDTQGNPRYRTGIIGKWDLGVDSGQTASERGFDESFMYRRHYRNDFRREALDCAPARGSYCTKSDGSGDAAVQCTQNTDCASVNWCKPNGTNICTCETGWGAYIGPDPNIKACSPASANADPLCCAAPLSRAVDGRYNFRDKRNGNNAAYWVIDGGENAACDTYSDSLAAGARASSSVACRYGTRFYSDAASNFIRRNAGRPFFLYVATHALHSKGDAPQKVKDHYLTNPFGSGLGRPKRGGGRVKPEKFWPTLEEVDAAIGRIIQTIREQNIQSKTLLFVTSDNAHEKSAKGASYGSPALRGNKGGLEEGGMRIGLAAWTGGDFLSRSADDLAAVGKAVTSHVDLFPTIAHAAGCKPNTDGQYRFGTCNGNIRRFCTTNTECSQAGAGNICVTRRIAGRTMLPLLSAKVRGYHEGQSNAEIKPRDYVFAEFPKTDPAIVTRTGLFDPSSANGFRVCGRRDTAVAGETADVEIARERFAGSTTTCSSNSDCTTAVCQGAGLFCVPDADKNDCKEGVGNCAWTKYRRCVTDEDCAGSITLSKCSPVNMPCLGCSPVATWKLRGNYQSGTWTVKSLFDLTTNPEEKTSLDFVGVSSTSSLNSVLLERLRRWYDCEQGKHGDDVAASKDCESRYP